MRLANSGGCLFAALLAFLFVAAAAASEDLSGRWKISYIVQSGGPDEKFAEGSVVSLSEKDSTLQGRATLGSRGDGFLIGSRQGSDVQVAITFRSNPALFLRLSGSQGDDGLQGSFTASGGGSFWQGKFAATQMTTAAGEVIGRVGATSAAESRMGPHLHFSVSRDGAVIDPHDYVNGGE